MNKVELLFPTPVGVFDIGSKCFNDEILTTPSIGISSHDIWKCSSRALDLLKDKFKEYALEVLEYSPAMQHSTFSSVEIGRGWIQTCNRGQFHHAHNHADSLLVGVYYIQAEPNCGDLLLYDPAANSNWSNYYDRGQDCRVWKRIQPLTGRLVIFPGHIVHSTDANSTDIPRIAIATNFSITFR